MKWLWNWSKPKISSIVDNSQLEALRNDLTTLQNNVSNIQASLSSYLTNNQSYSLTNTSDKFVINVAKSANYLELQRGGSRKTTIGLGSSSSDNFSIESTGNIVLKPNQYIDANGSPIQNVASPTQANQVTTKQYVDTLTTTNTNSINSLTTRVTNLENKNVSNSNLSKVYGKVTWTNPISKFENFTTLYCSASSITLTDGTIIQFKDLQKYIISYSYGFNSTIFISSGSSSDPRQGGMFLSPDYFYNSLGLYLGNTSFSMNLIWMNTTGASTRNVTWKTNVKPYFEVVLILSDSLEMITKNILNKSSYSLKSTTNVDETMEVVSWESME